MKNTFAEKKAQQIAAFNEMKAKHSEEYYTLRKCAAEIVKGGKLKAAHTIQEGNLQVGIVCLDNPTLFVQNGKDRSTRQTYEMVELEEYFSHGHIKDGLWEHQLDEAIRSIFKSINKFLLKLK